MFCISHPNRWSPLLSTSLARVGVHRTEIPFHRIPHLLLQLRLRGRKQSWESFGGKLTRALRLLLHTISGREMMFLPPWRLGILFPTYREISSELKSVFWTFRECPFAMHSFLSSSQTCALFHILPLVALLGFYWVYFRFASCLNVNDELLVAFPAGWNGGTHCSFRWDEGSLSQQRAELSHRLLLNSVSTHLPGWISSKYFLHFGIFYPFSALLPVFNLLCSAR